MSRADLWAFAGLAALDDTLKTSRELCEEVPEEVTCNDWTSSCYSPFPQGKAESFLKLEGLTAFQVQQKLLNKVSILILI